MPDCGRNGTRAQRALRRAVGRHGRSIMQLLLCGSALRRRSIRLISRKPPARERAKLTAAAGRRQMFRTLPRRGGGAPGRGPQVCLCVQLTRRTRFVGYAELSESPFSRLVYSSYFTLLKHPLPPPQKTLLLHRCLNLLSLSC